MTELPIILSYRNQSIDFQSKYTYIKYVNIMY